MLIIFLRQIRAECYLQRPSFLVGNKDNMDGDRNVGQHNHSAIEDIESGQGAAPNTVS